MLAGCLLIVYLEWAFSLEKGRPMGAVDDHDYRTARDHG
jgi:hypothetical protein